MSILNRIFIDAHYLMGLEHGLRGFDLVHTAETYYRYTQQALNAKKRGYVKKVIATVWETIPYNNEGIWGRKTYKRRAIRELDHIIAVTNKAKRALVLEGANPANITVIAPGVDTDLFSPGVFRKKPQTIVFVGRPVPEKGGDDLARILPLLPKGIHVRFVGQGEVAYEDMPKVYKEADIFVAPSRVTKTWEEQYGMALLEAQAGGLPIVTTRSGGIPENVGDAAVLIESGDVRSLVRAIYDLLEHPQKRVKLAKRARARALAVHDARRAANKIAELYDRVLQ